MLLSFFIILRITVALAIILEDSDDIFDIPRYVLKISNIRTRLFNSAVLFTALIAMLRHSSGDDYDISA